MTCRGGARLREALELMRRSNVGSVVITTPEGSPEGIFTERDLLRLAAGGELDTAAPITRFITRNPIALPDSASAYDAARAMARHGIRHVLVVSRGELNEFDRRILKESLRQARRLQQRLALDYRR